jgi:hypothetical protein
MDAAKARRPPLESKRRCPEETMQTMRSDTKAVTIPASYEAVFAFLTNPENLPRWAVGFARAIRRDGETWLVTTNQGELPIRYVVDADRGVIDYHLEPAPGAEAVAYSRLVPNGDGVEYVFTQFQAPGMPDEVFVGQVAALAEELAILPALFRAQAACGPPDELGPQEAFHDR